MHRHSATAFHVKNLVAAVKGKRVVDIVEADIGFGERAPALVFEDGVAVVILRDDEGNGPGAVEVIRFPPAAKPVTRRRA